MNSIAGLMIVLPLALIAWMFISDKLRRFPGPFVAKITSLWQLWDQYKNIDADPVRHLHDKYGKIVRVAPNKLFFSDAADIKEIFSVNHNLKKSEYYPSAAPAANGKPEFNFFSTDDMKYHDTVRKATYKAFTVVDDYEKAVDDSISLFIGQIRSRFADREDVDGIIDLAKWTHYFALDTISAISYSKRYGFMETDSDVGGMIRLIDFALTYHAYVGQAPWLDKILAKNPLLMFANRRGYLNAITAPVAFALSSQQHRQEQLDGKTGQDPHNDLLGSWNRLKVSKASVFNDTEILKTGLAVVFAGGDSTARLLAAAFYHLMGNPQIYAKLEAEIDATPTNLRYDEASQLPYLRAVVKETMRMFPVVRFSLERLTPAEGIMIGGCFIPGKTVVAANSWPVHRDPEIWGPDVDSFRPERWISASTEQFKFMDNTLFLFGYGKFQCLGKNIVYLEIFKLLPAVLRAFKVEPAYPGKKWTYGQGEFVTLKGVDARIHKRA